MAVVELPPNSLPSKPPAFDSWPELSRAYDRTLFAEIHAAERVEADQGAQNNVIFARIVGYLLLETFERRGTLGNGPCRALVTSLLSDVREPAEDEHDIVFRVGKSHCDHLIRLFLPSSKEHPGPRWPSFPLFSNMEESTTEEDLVRQCDELTANATLLNGCCIIGESVEQCIDVTSERGVDAVTRKTDHAITATSVLARFGLGKLAERLVRDAIHDIKNLISLDPNCHVYFNKLLLWFEETATPNRYRVCASDHRYAIYFSGREHLELDDGHLVATFSGPDGNSQPPDPQLLALHAACTRVAHMSGAIVALHRLENDLEDARVTSFDG